MMKRVMIVMVAVAALTACGSSGARTVATSSTTTTLPEHDLSVRYVARQDGGIGCIDSPVGTGEQLIVKNAAGTTVGTGTFALSPDADSCDWTATTTVEESSYYGIFADQVSIYTVPLAEMKKAHWAIKLTFG